MDKPLSPIGLRGKEFGLKTLSEFEEKDVEWIWYPYLARGELTIVEGDPESKKSFMIQAVARHLADGRELPSRWPDYQPDPGNVVLFDCENSGDTVLKRRFRYLRLRNHDRIIIKEDPFQMIDTDIDKILLAIRRTRPLLVVFDTVNDYLDSAKSTNNGRDVTQALQPFRKLAKELNCAVVLIRHLTKDSNKKALYRGQGSISFVGKARIVITVAPHPEEEGVSCMAVTKLSLGKKPKTLTYEVRDESTSEERHAFSFCWGGHIDLTAEQLVNPDKEQGRPPQERDEAKDFLLEALEEGPVEVRRLERMADARSISMSTLRRAANELNIVKPRGGPNSTWQLPQLKRRA